MRVEITITTESGKVTIEHTDPTDRLGRCTATPQQILAKAVTDAKAWLRRNPPKREGGRP